MTVVQAPTGTNDTAGARRLRDVFARTRADDRAAFIPYVVAGYPDAETGLDIALAVADAGADILEIGLPYSDPLADGATLQRASQVALRAGASLEGSLRLIERIGAQRPEVPLVPMGYANQVIGGGDGEAVLRRLAGAGAAGVIVADLTPDEGASFEAVARSVGMAVIYLVAPTTPPERRERVAARSGGGGGRGRRGPLLRVADRPDRRAVGSRPGGRPARRRGPSRLAGPGRCRVRDQQPGARRGRRDGRGGRHRGGVGAGRCTRAGRPRSRRCDPTQPRPASRHDPLAPVS